ncbi:MAG TPA: hypothetical protein VIL24_04715 [Clostridia bacterium]
MKKFRRLVITFLILIMSLTLLSGNLMTVMAADTGTIQPVTIGKLPKEGVIGQAIDLGELQNCDVRVKDPLDNDVTLDDNKFTPTKAGYYTVNVYGNNGIFYEGFKIKVTVDDAVIYIPYNGAEIPTYIAPGSPIKLPKASMVVYDEDGKIDQEKTNALNYTIKYYVTNPEGVQTELTATDADGFYVYSGDNTKVSGSYLVRYKATAQDNAAVKTSDFIVHVQEGFEDKEKPTLTVTGVPNTAAQRVKLTLPKATATDNKDENVKITVTVKDSDGQDVLVVDDSDPKNLVLGTEKVVFDNDKNMSFYPWKTGTYKVTYKAVDDSGNVSEKTFSINNVSDTQAPTIELDENVIPGKWAISITNSKGLLEGNDRLLVIPKPEVWDNVTPKDQIDLSLTIKNASGEEVYNSTKTTQPYEGFLTQDDDNYYLDFDVLTTKTGIFTLTFTAKDKDANGKLKNSRSKVIDVNVVEELKDTLNPKVQATNIPEYIMVGDKFLEPNITPVDPSNANSEATKVIIKKTYEFIVSEANVTKFDFKTKNYFIPKEAGTIKITLEIKDSVGNKVLDENDNEVDSLVYTVDVYSEEINTNAPTFKAGLTWEDKKNPDTSLFKEVEGELVQRTINYKDKNSKKVTVGDIVIQSATDQYDFIGYEVIVRAPGSVTVGSTEGSTEYQGAGQRLNTTVKSKLYFNDTDNKWELVLENISFEVNKEGKHSLTVRAFNMSGASTLATVTFDVVGTAVVDNSYMGGATIGSNQNLGGLVTGLSYNTDLPTEVELGETYALPLKNIEGKKLVAREINGPAYELKGNMFTPKAVGQYTITLYNENGDKDSSVTVTCVDTKTPEFKLLGEVPSYYKKYDAETNPDAFVEIPEVSIIDKGDLKEYTVKVVDNNNQIVAIETREGKKGFVPRVDGTYTITYTVYDSTNTASYSITVKVGDLIKPVIIDVDLIKPDVTKFKQNDKLYAKELTKDNVSDNVSKADKLEITRTLYGPNGNPVSAEKDDKNKEYYVLKDAGTYTLTYTVKDEAGNVYTKEFIITVTGEGKKPFNYQLLSTVLIITAIVLIVGVGIYFFRFRKVKEKSN